MLVSTKSLDINIDFWGFDINLKVFLGTKLALYGRNYSSFKRMGRVCYAVGKHCEEG